MFTFAGAVLLATTVVVSGDPSEFENPKFCSSDGETCLVIRRYPAVGDFERVTSEAYWRRDAVQEWLDEYPSAESEPEKKPEPVRGALYRLWPGGYRQLLSEFDFPQRPKDHALVADDGHFVIYGGAMECGAKAELLTIHAPDGSVVRTLLARDVFTRNDHQWLCRGSATDVRFSIEDELGTSKLRTMFLVTEGEWDQPEARRETLEIELATGTVPPPERDRCPAALLVAAEADDGTSPYKTSPVIGDQRAFRDPEVVSLASQAILDRAVTRIIPEYPDVAWKARIAGRVYVDVVVGRDGRVEALRLEPIPFGIDEAVKTAVMNWEFAPYPSPAEAVRFSGSFVFRFEIVRPLRLATTTISCHWR